MRKEIRKMTQTQLTNLATDGGKEQMTNEEIFQSVRDALNEDGVETDWVSEYDVKRIRSARDGDWDGFLDTYDSDSSRVTITFPNKASAVLWVAEIAGQISDGAWENRNWSYPNSWEDLTCASLEIDEDLDEAKSDGQHANLGYLRMANRHEEMLGRMAFYVRAALDLDDYGVEDVRDDLRAIKGINN